MAITKAQLELLKREAYNDFYTFAKYVCQWTEMEEQPHREMCYFATMGLEDWVDNRGNKMLVNYQPPVTTEQIKAMYERAGESWLARHKKLIQVPRSSFKSSVISNALILWLLWHNPNIRIMIGSETLGNSKLYLSAIKDQIENNELLRIICTNDKGVYLLEPAKDVTGGWTEDQVLLKHRTDLGRKEPTIFCTSVENTRTGLHPDVIVFDDLVSEGNVNTANNIQKTKDVYKYSLSLLDPTGILFVVGTRYHYNDLYNDLLKSTSFDKLVRPAVLPDTGELYFPKRITQAFLDEKKQEQGTYIFSCQYMLEPVDDAMRDFQKHWFKWFKADDLEEIVEKCINYYVVTDFAISLKKRADYTVIMAVGETFDKKLYVLEYDRDRLNPHETIQALFEMCAKYKKRLRRVQIESVAFQASMMYLIKNEQKRRGVRLPLLETKPRQNKEERIKLLIPLFERGEVFLKEGMQDLYDELVSLGSWEHDDVADALSNILECLKPYVLLATDSTDDPITIRNRRTNY